MKAIIFDLDGVLTETQKLHEKAWREMFNAFLPEPLSGDDYRRYLDGKPREVGIRSMLSARNIQLGDEEIHALGKEKNKLYIEALKKEGPHLIDESFSFVVRMFAKKLPMAVVSSSRNCRMIMEETNLIQFIPVLVTPEEADIKNLRGKPDPDYFLEACRLLKVAPSESIMVEDAISGIEAGKKAGFGKVVGIKIRNDPQGLNELKSAGADEVVSSLWSVSGMDDYLKLDDAGKNFSKILQRNQNHFLFLDFDGTISEIVKDPAQAKPLEGVVKLISELADMMPVCIITGRDTEVIRNLIDLPHIHYAACHGFEISGPAGLHYELAEARAIIPEFDKAQSSLTKKLGEFKGIVIERKKFGLAFHYRMITSPDIRNKLISEVSDYCGKHGFFKVRPGEEVIEILPNLNWHKGKALLKLYEVLKLSKTKFPPLYFGDGKTDEDAFREMINWGTSILISDHDRPSLAHYKIANPADTKVILEKIKASMEKKIERMDFELR